MKHRVPLRASYALTLVTVALWSPSQDEVLWIDAGFHHLGDDETPEWSEAPPAPEGRRLDLTFESTQNETEWVLALRQRSIDNTWRVLLGDREVAILRPGADLALEHYVVPAGAVRDGRNTLSFVPDTPTDDVTLGEVRLHRETLRELFDLGPVEVRVFDDATGAQLPARVSLFADGVAPGVYYAVDLGAQGAVAARPGTVYTGTGAVRFEVPRGTYRCVASRGMEWSLSEVEVAVGGEGPGTVAPVEHRLRREVDTTGFVACDTHIHTLTHSGHGDASVEERVTTLAGEGVELAIATDHNHNTDYTAQRAQLGLAEHFTSVVGNEVTTPVGHFNAFPLDPADPIPEHELEDVVRLVESMRGKGARVVILNHPRWPSHEDSPFGNAHLSHETGAREPAFPLPVDALELVNSTTDETDPLLLFRDWFALVNRGEALVAAGSSDSHTVGDPVGGGRTYVASATDDPARIDVAAACDALRTGRSVIAMGIFVTATVGEASSGDTLRSDERRLPVEIRVQAPHWIRPERVRLFANGLEVATTNLRTKADQATDARVVLEPSLPAHDVWLVCVVTGSDPGGPHWPAHNDYSLGATNPVYVDRGEDGWHAPRALAQRLLEVHGADELESALREYDPVVRRHARDLTEGR
jgi:hypothetical protein